MGLKGDLGVAAQSSAVRICVCLCARILILIFYLLFDAMLQLRSPPFESVCMYTYFFLLKKFGVHLLFF